MNGADTPCPAAEHRGVAMSDRAIEDHSVSTFRRTIVAQLAPSLVAVNRATDTLRARHRRPTVVSKPPIAVGPRHSQLDQQVAGTGVVNIEPIANTPDLIDGKTDPLLGPHALRYSLWMRIAQQTANCRLMGFNAYSPVHICTSADLTRRGVVSELGGERLVDR
ncbi:hypothetical protein [Sciscionella marina]|uniref:hypothetical protein n=1 Tax=Sciscionella marina TaxID=508770 RepID=UPI0012F62714|nr:hypothetical protein [Sciscionella marina]